MSTHDDKGKRYVGLLDAARANGKWSDIPELIRKVNKHAPSQTILIQTATAEQYIATRAAQRPQTAAKDASNPLTSLQTSVDSAQNGLAEDVFQARSCLIWAAHTDAISSRAGSSTVSDVVPTFDRYGQKATSIMTKICLLRTVFFQGQEHANKNEIPRAGLIWRAAISWIELNLEQIRSTPQMSYWAEQILAAAGTIHSDLTDIQISALNTWSLLTARTKEVPPGIYGNFASHISRTSIHAVHYKLLSKSLAESSNLPRSQLAGQIRRAESTYEAVLLNNRKFPKATESNASVEEWVEQVMNNWQIMCGPSWSEDDLGEGGRNAVTRNVLDILYRAATKTFHSLLILRRLFQVHKSLTEFNLAYKCLDTYIELAVTARQRAKKAGDQSPESDEIMLLTVAEGIEGLCSYGRQKEARQASELADKLEDWLDEIELETDQSNGHVNGDYQQHGVHTLSTEVLQTTYRAIGIARARWGKWTPFTETRTDLQADGMTALLKAASYGASTPQTLYALALLCAETRQIPEALRYAKAGLQELSSNHFAPIDQQAALWHLLTLLLSSQQDFETGMQTCSASIDSIILSSTSSVNTSGISAVADLECDNLHRLIELQTTYLAFVELNDGPETALNHSDELLSLYWKLFRKYQIGDIKQATDNNLVPPKTSAGTVHSIRGSIFSRRKQTPSIVPSATTASLISNSTVETDTRPMTQASQAPTIQVTDETGKSPSRKHHHSLLHHRHHEKDSNRKASKDSRPQTASTIKASSPAVSPPSQSSPTTTSTLDHAQTITSEHDQSPETKQELINIPHNVTSHEKAPPPLHHDENPPEQDVRLPTVHSGTTSTSPIPRFPQTQAQKHALVILHKIWLIVAKLYQRAHIFEDAREALDEATKTARRIEQLVSTADSSSRALADPAWGGGGKSSDEIWADTYHARASLQHAIASQRAEVDKTTPISSETLREVVDQYEQCLMYFPNHPAGIVGLSNILLDYYDHKIDLSKRVDDGRIPGVNSVQKGETFPITPQDSLVDPFTKTSIATDLRKTPENLNRIAARDRAYGLLNTLTKLGTGWDNSEAWFALARAHELGGEVEKAKKILWWCIELEDTRPIRHWRNLGNGYVL